MKWIEDNLTGKKRVGRCEKKERKLSLYFLFPYKKTTIFYYKQRY